MKVSKTKDIWYVGPLTKTHIAELRKKLAKTRGILYSVVYAMQDKKRNQMPSEKEITDIIADTID
jgi:hypothetical protein